MNLAGSLPCDTHGNDPAGFKRPLKNSSLPFFPLFVKTLMNKVREGYKLWHRATLVYWHPHTFKPSKYKTKDL